MAARTGEAQECWVYSRLRVRPDVEKSSHLIRVMPAQEVASQVLALIDSRFQVSLWRLPGQEEP
jgi:hypothetical protein